MSKTLVFTVEVSLPADPIDAAVLITKMSPAREAFVAMLVEAKIDFDADSKIVAKRPQPVPKPRAVA
jgi:hypothetical protein